MNRQLEWRRRPEIEPMAVPYPWRRMAFSVAVGAACVAAGMFLVWV